MGSSGYCCKRAHEKAEARRSAASAVPRAMSEAVIAGFYFATPYHAWERGLNENTNGLVRQYFPKGTSLATVTQRDVRRVQNLLNARPRKTLAYKSPNEIFFGT